MLGCLSSLTVVLSMYLCVRVELDYVPWDTPDAAEFGHGEPAMLLKLLDFARSTGLKFHFFAANRVLRAFPATAEAVLNDGHDLDWFCKHPEAAAERVAEAQELFSSLGRPAKGFSIRGHWQPSYSADWTDGFEFCSAAPSSTPPPLRLFAVETKSDRDAARNGVSARTWADGIKLAVRDGASRYRGVTVCVRPQVMAKYDPRLMLLREITDLAQAVGLPNRTLRELV